MEAFKELMAEALKKLKNYIVWNKLKLIIVFHCLKRFCLCIYIYVHCRINLKAYKKE